MANQGYLTYNQPSISELFGGMKPPSWLTEGVQYKPFEYQLAVADQMDKMSKAQAERDRQEAEAQAQLDRQNQARSSIQGDLQGLDLSKTDPRDILMKVQKGLFDAGLIDQGIAATRGLVGKQEQPKVQRVGNSIVQISPDGTVRELYQGKDSGSSKKGKEEIFTDGKGNFETPSTSEQKVALMKQGYYKTTGAKPKGPSLEDILNSPTDNTGAPNDSSPGMMDKIGAWLSDFYNQPMVNPRQTNDAPSPGTLDPGATMGSNGARRVFTVRRKTVAG